MSDISEASHRARIARANAELANHPTIIRNWANHHNIFDFEPLDESNVAPEIRRYRAAYDLEMKRRAFLLALREFTVTNGSFMQWAVKLDEVHVRNCRVAPSRIEMLDHLPKNAVVAEVGTEFGIYAEQIVHRTRPRELHLVDKTFGLFQRERVQGALDAGIIHFHEGDSSTTLAQFAPATFDWIYIDAGHTYQEVKADLLAAHDKVKPDGYLVFNDYTSWAIMSAVAYGIPAAVNEFALEYGWEFMWIAFEPQGYHDVALRRIPNYRTT